MAIESVPSDQTYLCVRVESVLTLLLRLTEPGRGLAEKTPSLLTLLRLLTESSPGRAESSRLSKHLGITIDALSSESCWKYGTSSCQGAPGLRRLLCCYLHLSRSRFVAVCEARSTSIFVRDNDPRGSLNRA